MNIKALLEKDLKETLRKSFQLDVKDVSVARPADTKFSDYTSNIAFLLAKEIKKTPFEIALKIASSFPKRKEYLNVDAQNGFVNMFFSDSFYQQEIAKIFQEKENYAKTDDVKKKTVVIDYSAPNIGKPMGAGHLRSTIIGRAIYNLHTFFGWKVIGDNHVGDWGTQFGKVLYAYKVWGDPKKVKENSTKELFDLYVRFTKEAKENDELNDKAREEFRKLETGDTENRTLWKMFVTQNLKDFDKIYKVLGVSFEETLGESFYEEKLPGVIKEVLEKKVAKKDPDGSVVVDLEDENLGKALIQKKDGATLYMTRDIATYEYRIERFHPDKILYVIGRDQGLYLKQLFRIVERLGYKGVEVHHIDFGLLRLEGKRMATREGRTIFLEQVLSDAINRAKAITKEKNRDLTPKEQDEVAQHIGVGAVKYNDLSQNRVSDIDFDWERMLNIQGNSAPYLQYTHARACSVIEKAGKKGESFDISALEATSERTLMRKLPLFEEVIWEAYTRYLPNLLANYLFDLSQTFNVFYNNEPILTAPQDLRSARLALTVSVAQLLENGLAILGIKAPRKM